MTVFQHSIVGNQSFLTNVDIKTCFELFLQHIMMVNNGLTESEWDILCMFL